MAEESSQHLVVLDFLSLVHPFAHQISEIPQIIGDLNLLCHNWVSYFSNPYLYTPLTNPVDLDPSKARPILCVDIKSNKNKYWRHKYLPQYKTGRRTKSSLVIQLRDQLLTEWLAAGLPVLMEPSFEADDWAGALTNSPQTKDAKIALVSVDSDWAQLVNDRVMWMDVFPPSRRRGESQTKSVLGVSGVLERFNNQERFKKTRLITSPFDLVDHKHEFGDTSDRIPPGRVVDIGLIDLTNPKQTIPNVEERIRVALNEPYQMLLPNKVSSHCLFGVPSWLGDIYG